MAQGNLPACLAVTLKHEGGWSDHPKDPGGATMRGVTLATYRRFRPGATKEHLRAISDTEVQAIYQGGYWQPVAGEKLPHGVDLAAFDYSVNSGVSRAVRALQGVLSVKQDGIPGPATVGAANVTDGKATVQRLCGQRMGFLRGLGTWSTFRGGWTRRVADVEARSVAMWLARGKALTPAQRKELEAEGKKADQTATKQNGGAGGAGAGGAATVATDLNWWIVGGVIVVALVIAGILILKARQNRERAKAYAAVAAAS